MRVYQASYPVLKPTLQYKGELIEAENKSEAKQMIIDKEPHLTHHSNIKLYCIIPPNEFDKYIRSIDEFGQTVYYKKEEVK